MIKAIFFDLDDTLYNEIDYVMSGFKVVSSYISSQFDLSQKEVFKILKQDFKEGVRAKNFNLLIEKLDLNCDPLILVEMYRKHNPSISLSNEVKKLLIDLKKRFFLGIITDGFEIAQDAKIAALNLSNLVDFIKVNNLQKKESKLQSNCFNEALNFFGILASEAIYVGDNISKDFIQPKILGMKTAYFLNKKGLHNYLSVDKSLDTDISFSDWPSFVNKIEKI